MGYTHSWYREQSINESAYNSIKADFGKIVELLPLESKVAHASGFSSQDDVSFTGLMGGCEPLIFSRESHARVITPERAGKDTWKLGRCFEFCKTDRMSYDLAVTAFLVVAKRHLGESIRIFSDGNDEAWSAAKKLCSAGLKYGDSFHIVQGELR